MKQSGAAAIERAYFKLVVHRYELGACSYLCCHGYNIKVREPSPAGSHQSAQMTDKS